MACICVMSSLYHRRIRLSLCNVYMYFSLHDGETVLMMASNAGHVNCVMLLLNKGASTDLSNKVRCSDTSSIVWLACSLV